MFNENFSRRKAFSLVELFIAMVIIAIFASFIMANITSQNQTVKQEAERLVAYITDLMRKADRRHTNLTIKFESGKVSCNSVSSDFTLPSGFSVSEVSQNFSNKQLKYDSNKNEFDQNGKIKITRALGQTNYYIHFRYGRVRASESAEEESD